jgi:hypothetical protein
MHQLTHISVVAKKKENIFRNYAILKTPLSQWNTLIDAGIQLSG